MALDIVVDAEKPEDTGDQRDERQESLVSWVMSHVDDWEQYRDNNFKAKWDEYYRLWRGIWSDEDKTRSSERSKLISPALSQAIESSVAEIEEGVLGRERWFDVSDDYTDQEKEEFGLYRNLLLEDFKKEGVAEAISEIILQGALYGTGIGKLVVAEEVDKTIGATGQFVRTAIADTDVRVSVELIAVSPSEFAIDPSAKTIDEALGCAHTPVVPRHIIIEKQAAGIYLDGDIGSFDASEELARSGESSPQDTSDLVKVVEYHGLVPRYLMQPDLEEDEEFIEVLEDEDNEEDELVEALVTIANGATLLRAVENPYTMKDRGFIAFQYDTIPNRFWGRGVAEKGYNPQKALDAELRARIDAMALNVHPMLAMDATRIPRGIDFTVAPGKNILTNGDPHSVLMPFNFGNVNPATFTQSGEFEKMIQMGTGAIDSSAAGSQIGGSTAAGMGMMHSPSIKRIKRTLANIERTFTTPLIHKALWRYMQFDPARYPVKDIRFKAHGTLGIMARELEQNQLSNMLKTVPADSPAYWLLIKAIYEHSSITNKEEMLQIIGTFLEKSMNPPPPQPTVADQVAMEQLKIAQGELQLKTAKEQAAIQERMISLQIEKSRADTERARVMGELAQTDSENRKTEAEAALALAKARAEDIDSELSQLQVISDALNGQNQEQ